MVIDKGIWSHIYCSLLSGIYLYGIYLYSKYLVAVIWHQYAKREENIWKAFS